MLARQSRSDAAGRAARSHLPEFRSPELSYVKRRSCSVGRRKEISILPRQFNPIFSIEAEASGFMQTQEVDVLSIGDNQVQTRIFVGESACRVGHTHSGEARSGDRIMHFNDLPHQGRSGDWSWLQWVLIVGKFAPDYVACKWDRRNRKVGQSRRPSIKRTYDLDDLASCKDHFCFFIERG